MIFLVATLSCKHKDQLKNDITKIVEKANGTIGVAIKNLETNDTLTINNNHKYPMQSVYKFPLAMAVLSKVDSAIFSMDQKIHIAKSDLLPNTFLNILNIHVSL